MPDIMDDAIRFFIKFSKFECALKYDGYLKTPNGKAEANWHTFAAATGLSLQTLVENPHIGESVQYLIASPPKIQYAENGRLLWREVRQPDHVNDLIDCIKRVRNNLFHGGKYNCSEFDHPERSRVLIHACVAIMDELSQFLTTGIE